MTKSPRGKTALITGAGTGIGLAVALRFAPRAPGSSSPIATHAAAAPAVTTIGAAALWPR